MLNLIDLSNPAPALRDVESLAERIGYLRDVVDHRRRRDLGILSTLMRLFTLNFAQPDHAAFDQGLHPYDLSGVTRGASSLKLRGRASSDVMFEISSLYDHDSFRRYRPYIASVLSTRHLTHLEALVILADFQISLEIGPERERASATIIQFTQRFSSPRRGAN